MIHLSGRKIVRRNKLSNDQNAVRGKNIGVIRKQEGTCAVLYGSSHDLEEVRITAARPDGSTIEVLGAYRTLREDWIISSK